MVETAHKVGPEAVQARLGAATPERVAVFCRAHGIVWLALFGSVLRDDFRPDSDIDTLYVLAPGRKITTIDALMDMKDKWAALIGGHEVDLIAVKNLRWRIRDRVLADAVTLYGERPAEYASPLMADEREWSSVKDENLYLGDMLDIAREARGLVAGRERAELDTDRMFELAVLHLVQTIGEAATNVSRETCALHPDIPWGKIIGMRNVVVHRYDAVDDDVVWAVLTVHLVPLIAELEAMLPPEMREEP